MYSHVVSIAHESDRSWLYWRFHDSPTSAFGSGTAAFAPDAGYRNGEFELRELIRSTHENRARLDILRLNQWLDLDPPYKESSWEFQSMLLVLGSATPGDGSINGSGAPPLLVHPPPSES